LEVIEVKEVREVNAFRGAGSDLFIVLRSTIKRFNNSTLHITH